MYKNWHRLAKFVIEIGVRILAAQKYLEIQGIEETPGAARILLQRLWITYISIMKIPIVADNT